MKTYFENPGSSPKHPLPKATGKPAHLERIPLSVAICTIVASIVASSAAAAPISCYTPPDGVMSRTPRACVNPSDIPNFVTALPIPGAMTATPAGTGMMPDTMNFKVVLRQGTQQMLPASAGFKPSTIWGYADGTKDQFSVNANGITTVSNPTLYAPGNAIIVNKNTPAVVIYDSTILPASHPLAIAQDWGLTSSMPFTTGYVDPIFGKSIGPGVGAGLDNRVAVHSHGLANSSTSDGASWDFFPNKHQTAPMANQAVYTYPNAQNGGLYWFHDHAMGQTRLNAYMGLAAPYIIRDPAHPIDAMLLKPAGTTGALPAAYELPLVLQDRDFTDVSSTPGANEQYYEEAPSGPERFGSIWMVNGATTPFVNVTNHVYRLRLLNGSQARVATLALHIEASDSATNKQTVKWKPAMYVIGHEQGADPTLSRAVNSVTIAPGERLDLLVDFRLAGKQSNGNFKFLLVNTAPAPYPGGIACAAPGTVGGLPAGTAVNSTGQPLASANQLNNCIPQAVWAYNPKTGLPDKKIATPISQVMEFRLSKDRVPGTTPGTLVAAAATALDNWLPFPDGGKITAKKINPDPRSLLEQTTAKLCGGLTMPAGQLCDFHYLMSVHALKERIFNLYDLPFANLVLGPMVLKPQDLRYGVNIDNVHYTDSGTENLGLPAEPVQNAMTTAAGSDVVEEVWTFVNATPDAHPMHEHLFAMQPLEREYFDALQYLNDSLGYPLLSAVNTLIPLPGATLDPLTGLPYPYHADPNALLTGGTGVAQGNPSKPSWDGIVGGMVNGVPQLANGAVDFHNYLAKNTAGVPCGPYGNTVPAATATCITASNAAANNLTAGIVTSGNPLTPQAPAPLAPEERNWKDVIVAMPGQVTRILVRTARPDGTSFSSQPAGTNNTALLFNNKTGSFPLHCHILEHEENDMMTSFSVQ